MEAAKNGLKDASGDLQVPHEAHFRFSNPGTGHFLSLSVDFLEDGVCGAA